MLDLACLTGGIVNIMIPANSIPEHIYFILNQTGASVIFLSDGKQLEKIRQDKSSLPNLKLAILLEGDSPEEWVINLSEFLSQSDAESLRRYRSEVKINSLATIMYTSGTTGQPKGIMFSHLNIVFKRFCRAMAIPGIGEKDRFLSYLPLYHTFGRYLEMVGCIFWGSEYIFMFFSVIINHEIITTDQQFTDISEF